jgi:predicted  nucleic acid-binding Zn-ribbon protein
MSRSKLLLDLQSIDSTCDAVEAKRKRFALALRGNKAEREAGTVLAQREDGLAAAESSLRKIQDERKSLRTKLEADTKTLYDDRRKSAREVQNLQLEVESLQRRLEHLDDEALEAMESRDQAEGERATAEAALEAARELWSRQRAALKAEDRRMQAALETLDGQRKQLRNAVEAADLTRYDQLRASKGGVAIAKLEGDACSACGRQASADEQRKHRSGQSQLIPCPGCGRILHA